MKKSLMVLLFAAALPLAAADLPKFMSGSWRATIGSVSMEEHWTTASGGLMLGMHRDVKSGKTSFEFLRIEPRADGIYYVAQPGGRPPTPFKLTSQSDSRVVFENLEHDFPQRIIYWLDEKARLCARVEGKDGRGEQWCWEKATLLP